MSDLRSSGKAADESSALATGVNQALSTDTPPWAVSMFNLLCQKITISNQDVKDDIAKMSESLKTVDKKAEEALQTATTSSAKIDSLTSKVESLSDMVTCLREQNITQQRHILKNETYSRRSNLLFRGFTYPSQATCDSMVRNILKQMQLTNVDSIPFVRCHYIDRNRQIIVRFQNYSDREKVWQKRFLLKGKPFYVAEDFPLEIAAERKQLNPVFQAAKGLPDYHRKVTLIGSQLKLKDELYSTSNLHEVPDAINPVSLAERTSASVHVFGGSTSRYYPLSNFYRREFVYEHVKYNSVEQAYQHKKAKFANDYNKCREIMFYNDPGKQKHLGEQIRGLNQDMCNLGYMRDILIAKFTQHPDLKDKLVHTGDKVLAEANSRDQLFSVGLPLTYTDILNQKSWKGQNQLGKLLMEVRQELRAT